MQHVSGHICLHYQEKLRAINEIFCNGGSSLFFVN